MNAITCVLTRTCLDGFEDQTDIDLSIFITRVVRRMPESLGCLSVFIVVRCVSWYRGENEHKTEE
jgi:hypothetical protein